MTTAEKLTIIAENQQKVYDAGYEKGKAESNNAYDEFWDIYQQNGERIDYTCAFGGIGWTDEMFKPKYNFNLASQSIAAYMMFRESKITDLSNYSFKFYNGQYMFSNMKSLKKMGDVYVTAGGNLYGTFAGCAALEEINSIRFDMTSGNFVSCFEGCSKLTNIKHIAGIIQGGNYTNSSTYKNYNHLNMAACVNLNKETIIRLIQALDDTEVVSGNLPKNISFSSKAINKAFETSEGANDGLTSSRWLSLVATKPTWTIIV